MRRIPLLIMASLLLGGCSSLGVKPWEREVLAREDMQLDSHALDAAIDDHIYFSKEGTSGGRGFGGGGCGCN
jgi:Domain of unknown function (DUF4266)